MGGKNRSEIKKQITNELSTEIKNITTNRVNINGLKPNLQGHILLP
jgi:hypothetical protein